MQKHCFHEHQHCLDCDKSFASDHLAMIHTKKVHGSQIECQFCSYVNYEWAIKFHEKKHELEKTVANEARQNQTQSSSNLPQVTKVSGRPLPPLKPIPILHNGTIIGHANDGDDSEEPDAKKAKMDVLYKPAQNKCAHCPQKFPDRNKLSQHCYSTHRECIDCDQIFPDYNSTFKHCTDLHGMITECKFCGLKSFQWVLENHMKSHRPDDTVKFPSKKPTRLVVMPDFNKIKPCMLNVETTKSAPPPVKKVIAIQSKATITPTTTTTSTNSLVITNVQSDSSVKGCLMCGVCKQPMLNENDVIKHLKHLNCPNCSFVTATQDLLDQHMNEGCSIDSILPD